MLGQGFVGAPHGHKKPHDRAQGKRQVPAVGARPQDEEAGEEVHS